MREFKIFVIVAFIIGVMYYGVEPLAHHAMHPPTAASNYDFKDLEKLGNIDVASGNAENGKNVFEGNCASCHTLNSQPDAGLNMRNPKALQPAGNGGVLPPDLSNAGLIYNSTYLAHFIKDPVRASLLDSKFEVSCEGLEDEAFDKCLASNEGKEMYPMNAFNGILNDSEIADVVAYLKSIAPKSLSDKEVFVEACSRCHSVAYDKNQYDSMFFTQHNAKIETLIKQAEGKEEVEFLESLNDEDKSFMNALLGMAKVKEKRQMTEGELDDNNEAINAKTFEDFGGALNVLNTSIIESGFNKPGLHAATDSEMIKAYLGNTPPDLSMMIRAKGHTELAAFINNPQKVPLNDIQRAVINKLVKNKQDEEKAALPADLSEGDRKAKVKEINARDAAYYGIVLPENSLKDSWQDADDYTNMAKDMGVMPQGKAMPRVGLTKEAETQVINYLETIGDSKKAQRDSLGLWIIAFFVLLSALAYMWKSKIWKDLH